MLIAAIACVFFAIHIVVESRLPAQARPAPMSVLDAMVESALHEETPVSNESADLKQEPMAEPPEAEVSWINIIPIEELEEMYEQYIAILEEHEYMLPHHGTDFFVTPSALYVSSSAIPQMYTLLPFYISENSYFYAAFWQTRPYLHIEDVIWKVNASVHVPFYSQIRMNHQPNPLFITPTYRLPYGFMPDILVPVNSDECILRATPETVAAFRSLRSSARQNGLDLAVTSAFRSAARQAELWEGGGRRGGRVARPYHSEHQTGRALDLWGPGGLLDSSGPSRTGIWVAANVHYHGFIIRYRPETTHITGYIHEPWHITYVGVEISMYMYTNNIISLEEFVGRNPGAAMIVPG